MFQSDEFRDELATLSDPDKRQVLQLAQEIQDDPYVGVRLPELSDPTLYAHGSEHFAVAYRLRQPRYTEPTSDPVPTLLAFLRTPSSADFLGHLRRIGLIP